MGDFKKLRVWQEACKFADRVEQMARQLPQPERTWAFEQLVPAAHAVHENIAEGWGFDTDPQRLKFCRQALSTGNESEDQLLALDRKDLLGQFVTLPNEARSLCAMTAKLKMRLEDSIAKSRPSRRRPNSRKPTARLKPSANGRKPSAAADSQPPAPGPDSRPPSDEPAEGR
jgi:four helix bundle protein